MNLLVVDWDFFFPMPTAEDPTWMLYDWATKEAPMYLEALWYPRAENFIRNDLPLPMPEDSWRRFWGRFRIDPGATLFTAESNCRAASERVANGVESVWLYDAHHDAGYHGPDAFLDDDGPMKGRFTCEDWMTHYFLRGLDPSTDLHVRYPKHRKHAFREEPQPSIPVDRRFDDGGPSLVQFGRVFVCRSGAWVPPWADDLYEEFVGLAPVASSPVELDRFDRTFDLEVAKEHAKQVAALMARANEGGD